MKTVFSGVQPTGGLTLGNYLGALKRFVEIQHEYRCFYCVVDLHALTVLPEPGALREQIEDVAAYMLAVGLDPQVCTLFLQSDVPPHAELGWIMECTATFGELSRMTQFKEKSEGRETVSGGLFTYPALMAADILLYGTDYVPVGEDQKQHVEICRDLAIRFNNRYGPTFTVPEPLIGSTGARVKSLQDPTKKMSKSDPNPLAYVSLGDSKDDIARKFRRAVTDSGATIAYDEVEKPAVSNLLTIYSHLTGETLEDLEARYEGKGYKVFKDDLAGTVIEALTPIQQRYRDIKYGGRLHDILSQGAMEAHSVANKTLKEVKTRLGLPGLTSETLARR